MLLSGAEVAATSVPDKSMTLIPKLAVIYRIEIALDYIRWVEHETDCNKSYGIKKKLKY